MTSYSDRYLASILAHASDVLLAVDANGRRLSWSASAERVFGRSTREVVGAPLDDALPGFSFAWLRDVLADRDRADLGELRIQRPDGHWAYVELSAAPV